VPTKRRSQEKKKKKTEIAQQQQNLISQRIRCFLNDMRYINSFYLLTLLTYNDKLQKSIGHEMPTDERNLTCRMSFRPSRPYVLSLPPRSPHWFQRAHVVINQAATYSYSYLGGDKSIRQLGLIVIQA